VLAVVQKGYVMNGRLLRPARVVVAREPDPSAD
jgi:molecular chaperone GrpE (heat shock protein)